MGSDEDDKDILPFSDLTDKNGYNAKFLSADRIDTILGSHFRDRKPLLRAKMSKYGGRILSLDFVYPIGKRVWVRRKDGTRFRPFKCLASITNEDSLVIWWGMLKGDESILAIQPHLVRLRLRTIYLGYDPKVVFYVDNCCTVRSKICEVWPEAIIKLDHFHWFARWDETLVNPRTSENARLFKALMSRAVLVAPEDEVNAKRISMTARLKRPVTVAEVLRECDTVAPPPDEMERLVWAVIEYFLKLDYQTEMQLANWPDDNTSPKPTLTFKRGAILQNVIRRQMVHVTKGCLSDPQHEDADFADLPMYTKVGNKTYCARGSGSNERTNLALEQDVIGGVPQMGPGRAERGIWTRFDEWNDKANIKRKGATNHRTRNTESLALANSLARQCRIEELPFRHVSSPTVDAAAPQEYMGFDTYAESTRCPETGSGNDDNSNDEEDEIDVEDEDNSVQNNTEAVTTNDTEDQLPDAAELEAAERVFEQVRNNIGRILNHRRYEGRETTMEAFKRQTGGNAWIPFSKNLESNDEVDVKERQLFDKLQSQYKRNVAPSDPNGYNFFEKAWDQEVGRRHLQALAGDNDIVLLRPKSTVQLQEYYDFLQSLEKDANHVTDAEEANRRSLFSTLKRARVEATGQVQSNPTAPIAYPTATGPMYVPFGAPVLHPEIFRHPFQQHQSPANQAPFYMNLPQRVAQPIQETVDYRIICRVCANAKRYHEKENGVLLFGRRCNLNYCGRCNRMKMDHIQMARKLQLHTGVPLMGPNCLFLNTT